MLVHIFLRNCVFVYDKKYPSFSAVYRLSIPGGYPHRSILLFQASWYRQFLHIAFVHDDDIDSGTLEVVNHKHYDYASTALTLVSVTNTTRLYGGEEEKEMLVFHMSFFSIPST